MKLWSLSSMHFNCGVLRCAETIISITELPNLCSTPRHSYHLSIISVLKRFLSPTGFVLYAMCRIKSHEQCNNNNKATIWNWSFEVINYNPYPDGCVVLLSVVCLVYVMVDEVLYTCPRLIFLFYTSPCFFFSPVCFRCEGRTEWVG